MASSGASATISQRDLYAAAVDEIGCEMPIVVGRYQPVSHNGKLIVIDTTTGECFEHDESVWGSLAPAIEPNANPVPAPQLP